MAFLIAVLLLGVTWQSAQAQLTPLSESAIEVVARRTAAPVSSLEVVKAASLAEAGIARFKVVDKDNGTIYGVDLDPEGNPVSEETIRQAVAAATSRGFRGKLENGVKSASCF